VDGESGRGREQKGTRGGGSESAREKGQWRRLGIRKEINSAIDKRPVKRQSAPVWVDEALSILDKKHNRRYPGDIERVLSPLSLSLSFSSLSRVLSLFFRIARIFFLSRRKVELMSGVHVVMPANSSDLFLFPLLSLSLSLSIYIYIYISFFYAKQKGSAILLYCRWRYPSKNYFRLLEELQRSVPNDVLPSIAEQ